MFSQAGRTSTEIFSHQLGLNKIRRNITPSRQIAAKRIQGPNIEPFDTTISREKVERARSNRTRTPSASHYNPRYTLVQKKPELIISFATSDRPKSPLSINDSFYDTNRKSKIKGFVELSKQVSRKLCQPVVSEARTTTYSSISVRRPRSANFKGPGHATNENTFNCLNFAYDINLSSVRRKISFAGPSFATQIGRETPVLRKRLQINTNPQYLMVSEILKSL
ncbi:hypothetical protein pb186bvf_018182 [Paramecium bursaria]